MQETWEEDKIDINGFELISLPAIPSQKGGRSRGGLAIAISLKMRAKLSLVHTFPPFAFTGLISSEKFSLLITNVYLPPGGLISDLHYRWDSLEDHLLACYVKYPNIPSIMGGDFNARTAANWNGIIKAKWWVSPPYPKSDLISFTSRRSKDNRVNEAGVLLYQLAIRMNLNILNGNCPPDVPGEFTHLGTTSNSVLDYLLVSEDLFSNFFYLKVDNVQSSDHLPLAAKLTLDWHPVSGTHPIHVGLNATAQVRGIKWSMKQAQKYAEFFQRNSSESLIVSLAELSEPNRILEWFFHFSADLTSFFTMPAHLANRDQPRFGAPWFDAKCKQARLSLCCIYNRYKASGAETLPPEYLQAKIAYKQAQKSAKHEWQLRRWQALIAASKLRSSRGFWNLINKRSRKYPLTVIPAPTWEQFLRKYFSQTDISNIQSDTLSSHLPIWPDTDPEEIVDLIAKLKTDKAPGPDLIPAEAIKQHPIWWAKILAKIFDAINATGQIPTSWKESIIIPIYKKGPPEDPGNYRNISLLSIIGKIYTRFLLTRLTQWAEDSNLIGHEQVGFRPNRASIDHAIILYHLARKYSSPTHGLLCAAFIDLKAAFDSISRELLWEKLAKWGIEKRLLWLLIKLHEGTAARVRLTPEGDLTNSVPINKGVRQGCILAPYLFNLYISDMRTPLAEAQTSIHAPRLADYRCPLLLYADDAVILSYSRIGLRRALKIFASYCQTNLLTINHSKSKVLIFSRSRKLYRWELEGKPIEQVYKFQYLGIYFQYNMGWKAHITYLQNKVKALIYALLRFFFTEGAMHVPSALKVYSAKVVATMAYAVPLWGAFVNLLPLVTLQNLFLRRLLKLPSCVSNSAIRLELKTPSLEILMWRHAFNYWLSLWHKLPNYHLIQCLWRDEFTSPWATKIHSKLLSYGISPSDILNLDLITAKKVIKQRLEEVDLQQNLTTGGGTCSPIYQGITSMSQIPRYLSTLSAASHRFAFVRARFNVFPSNVLSNRFSNGKISVLCACDNKSIESLYHILFNCPLYNVPRSRILSSIILEIAAKPPELHLAYLLQDIDSYRTLQVARFLISVLSYKRLHGMLHDY